MKKTMFNLMPPATIAVIILFWAFAPAAWTKSPWSIIVAGAVTTAFVQALEWFNERHAGWRLDKREFATDLFYVILGSTAISWVATKLAEDPLKAAKTSLGITTEWAMHLPFVVQVALVVVLIEFGQYWMHRLMHNSFLWWTHAPHHHITQLNAMKGAVGNPVELFLISLSVVALFDLPLAAEFCAFNILGAVATFAHANVRSDPPRWYAFFFTTIRNHSLHHTALSYEDTRCNYGNSLILMDRIFGTYREGESAIVGQDDRKRLSIWEQTIFPARPLIAKIKAKRDQSPLQAEVEPETVTG
jgi:sterol desaturase/sphingolipid hydroxylase (fatty acid hydroxylase superfamily)